MKDNGLTIYRLSKLSKVGYATLYDIIFQRTNNPRINTVSKIATALNEPIERLVKKEDKHEKNHLENQKI
ncbi:helix-turn-helix domain-containing protein [Clostridium sp. Mt-5]|uniref:Helix-turn-helix domain-containing protein n=1 Tax=Clostridium moutaii TaxID=3240932 RepID=A0ABV4BW69_9CLOT